jgi:TPR repeat protein
VKWSYYLCFFLFALNAFAEDRTTVIANLKKYCETTKNPMAKNSVACKVADGNQSLDELCNSIVKKDRVTSSKLYEVVTYYSMALEIDDDSAQAQLCPNELKILAENVTQQTECLAENGGTGSVSRRWWNGQAWLATTESIRVIKESADKGDAYSQFNLGYWLTQGAPCIAKNMNEGVPYLCKSYDQGFNMAEQHFGSRLNREQMGKEYGCKLTERQKAYTAETKVYEQKAKVYLKKAEAGDVAAMNKVGSLYLSNDYGLQQDYKKAFYWFEKAAKKGYAPAMGALAGMYNRGDGVEKNDEKVFHWTFKAAQKGDVDSMYFVGLLYYDGQGTTQNYIKAIQWLTKAWDRGSQDAEQHLYEMYLKGELQAAALSSLVQRVKALEKKLNQ